MASAVLKFTVVLLAIGVFEAVYSESETVSESCLHCICQAVSGCDTSTQCDGDICGLYDITSPYWIDAGMPTVNNQNSNASDAYKTCTIDPDCAATTVENYMTRYGSDCNNDGQVDCNDYFAIHMLGPYGCNGTVSSGVLQIFNECLALVASR